MRDLVEMTLNLVGRDYDEAKTLEKLAQDATQALGEKKSGVSLISLNFLLRKWSVYTKVLMIYHTMFC